MVSSICEAASALLPRRARESDGALVASRQVRMLTVRPRVSLSLFLCCKTGRTRRNTFRDRSKPRKSLSLFLYTLSKSKDRAPGEKPRLLTGAVCVTLSRLGTFTNARESTLRWCQRKYMRWVISLSLVPPLHTLTIVPPKACVLIYRWFYTEYNRYDFVQNCKLNYNYYYF